MKSISTYLTILLVCLTHYDIYSQEKMEVEGAIITQNSEAPAPAAGTIRWTGTDFEGWNGTEWMSWTTDPGTQAGEMQYWDSAWVTVAPGNTGQVLTLINGIPVWGPQLGMNDVQNPTTGKIWMDRNLGASQVATSSSDTAAYGDLYQWGRGTDGHEKRTSGTTSTLSNSDIPGHENFILAPNDDPFDWRNPQNEMLWQGVNGVNNPCPTGYRLPTDAELDADRTSWSSNDAAGAFASPLKLPLAGHRHRIDGSLRNLGSNGHYWSSTVDGTNSRNLNIQSSNAFVLANNRAWGFAVRCLKD